MDVTEEQAWSRAVEAYHPGAKGWVEVRGRMDPRPLWCIQFKNGVVFKSFVKHEVGGQANDYARSVVRLTGETP